MDLENEMAGEELGSVGSNKIKGGKSKEPVKVKK